MPPAVSRGGSPSSLYVIAMPKRRPSPRRADLRAAVREVDHHLGEAARGEMSEMPLDQRHAAHREQRLRLVCRQQAHSLAATGRENHGFHALKGVCGLCHCSRLCDSTPWFHLAAGHSR
jgi:hypothetical protein